MKTEPIALNPNEVIKSGDHNRIGDGVCSQVFIGKWKEKHVAIKDYKFTLSKKKITNNLPTRDKALEKMQKEVQIIKLLSECDGIITLWGSIGIESEQNDNIQLVMELAPMGSLSWILYNDNYPDRYCNFPNIPYQLIFSWLINISSIIAFINSKDILHRDVKADNVLVFNAFHIKLTDFDCAKFINEEFEYIGEGTMNFLAPEIRFGDESASFSSDVYSLGMTFLQILSRSYPDSSSGINEKIESVIDMFFNKYPDLKERNLLKSSLIDLLKECLNTQRDKRPTAEDVSYRMNSILSSDGSDTDYMSDAMYDIENNIIKKRESMFIKSKK